MSFYCAPGVVMTDDERTVWNTTYAIRFCEREQVLVRQFLPANKEAARHAAVKADTAVEALREEMKLRGRK